jgi:hypothetical protein
MVMRIIIYEDNEDDVKLLKYYLREFFHERKIKYEVKVYTHSYRMYDEVDRADVVFLDIEGLNDKLAYLSKLQSMDDSLSNIKTIVKEREAIPVLRKIDDRLAIANVSLCEIKDKPIMNSNSMKTGARKETPKRRNLFSRLFKR